MAPAICGNRLNLAKNSARQASFRARSRTTRFSLAGGGFTNNDEVYEEPEAQGILGKDRKACTCILPSCLRGDDNVRNRPNRSFAIRKRSILRMAFGYSLGWAVVWVSYLFVNVVRIYLTEVLSVILIPSQGLCNFIIFTLSKIRDEKRCNRELPWFQAFVKAFLSRGGIEQRIS